MSSSPYSNTHEDITVPSTNFHQHFRQQISALQDQIESLSAPDITADSRKVTGENILAGITKLSATLADASSDLASYDQRSYNQAIRSLHDQLAANQASHAPKAKFSFKNKKLASVGNGSVDSTSAQRSQLLSASPGPGSEIESAATSRSVTPAHLREDGCGALQSNKPTPAMAAPPVSRPIADVEQPYLQGHEFNPEAMTAESENDQTILTISSLRGTYASMLEPSQQSSSPSENIVLSPYQYTASRTCVISDVSESIVNLNPLSNIAQPDISSLTITSAKSSLLIIPSIGGPAHVTGVRDSMMIIGCRQFRMHDSHNVAVYLQCMSRPIIEDCTGIRFAPIPVQFARASFGEAKNMFDQVDDFKWLRAEHSPNWNVMSVNEQIRDDVWNTVLESIDQLDTSHGDEPTKAAATVKGMLGVLGCDSSR